QLIAADKPARGVVMGLVLDDAGHGCAAPHAYRALKDRIDRTGRVAHVVASDLSRAVRPPVRVPLRGRGKQQTRAFDRVPGHRDDTRALELFGSVLVDIAHTGDLAVVVMLDPGGVAMVADLKVAGRLAARNIGIGGRPFRAPFATLEAKTGLLAGYTVVVVDRVDGHAPGRDLAIACRLGAFFKHEVIVVPGQARPVI